MVRQTAGHVGENTGKLEPSCTAGGTGGTSYRAALWQGTWQFLKKLNTGLPYDPAIPLVGMIHNRSQQQSS